MTALEKKNRKALEPQFRGDLLIHSGHMFLLLLMMSVLLSRRWCTGTQISQLAAETKQ